METLEEGTVVTHTGTEGTIIGEICGTASTELPGLLALPEREIPTTEDELEEMLNRTHKSGYIAGLEQAVGCVRDRAVDFFNEKDDKEAMLCRDIVDELKKFIKYEIDKEG